MSAVDLSSFAGLTAMVLLTLNVLLGLLVTTNYNPRTHWPHRKIPIFKVHNWTAYVALSVLVLHPVILLFSSTAKFGLGDVLLPIDSPGQTFYNNLGAIAFYSILLVVVTSYLRPRIGYRTWRKLHWVAYFAAAVIFTHALLIDPNLKNQPPDLIDGEKVLVEGCFLSVVAATILRARYGSEKRRWKAAKQRGERVA
jgi:predicted ferric reductase